MQRKGGLLVGMENLEALPRGIGGKDSNVFYQAAGCAAYRIKARTPTQEQNLSTGGSGLPEPGGRKEKPGEGGDSLISKREGKQRKGRGVAGTTGEERAGPQTAESTRVPVDSQRAICFHRKGITETETCMLISADSKYGFPPK